MEKIDVILDIDTGTDDAVALMTAIASDFITVLGVTTVNGNQPVHITTENTLRVMDLLDCDIPVYRGCALPMVATLTPNRKPDIPRTTASLVEGDYLKMAPAKRRAAPLNAVSYLVETLKAAHASITIVATGPLTNIGMALRMDPSISRHIKEFVIMGGGHRIGNTTASAEYNIWIDPEAAKIVFSSGVPIRLIDLDATHEAYVTRAEALEMARLGTPPAVYASEFIIQRIDGYAVYNPELAEVDGAPVHDALCILALLDPAFIEWANCYLDVEAGGELCDGRTVVDLFRREKKPANANVSIHADRQKFIDFLFTHLSKLGSNNGVLSV